MKTTKGTYSFLRIMLLCGLLPFNAASADALNAERYVQIEIAAREAALAGARERLQQLGSGDGLAKQSRQLSDATHQKVSKVYQQAGISAGAHLAWENRNRRAIKAWLNENPDIQQRYNDLNDELNRLAAQIDALQGQ